MPDENKPDLTPDDVIERASASEKGKHGLAVLTGYLGASPKGADHVRFYFDLDLKTYCDIAVADIVHRERVERVDEPNASRIFVAADAVLRVVQEADVEASFLEGPIAEAHPIQEPESEPVSAADAASRRKRRCRTILRTCLLCGTRKTCTFGSKIGCTPKW
jgi:hypothetical protein